MHWLQRLNPALLHGRTWRALALGAAVVLAHALVLQLADQPPRLAPARSAALEVRQVMALQAEPPPWRHGLPRRDHRSPRRPCASESPCRAWTLHASRHPRRRPKWRASVCRLRQRRHRACQRRPVCRHRPNSCSRCSAARRAAKRVCRGAPRASATPLSLHATLPSGREVEQHSQGGFDAAGIAPLRLADRRHGRDVRAANFQREHGKVTFSGPRWELPLEAGTQDRLSWLVQLVALIGATHDDLRDGTELAMWVVGARGAASHWRFEVRGRQRVSFDAQAVEAWWLVREPVHPYDVRVEVWLSPQQRSLAAQAAPDTDSRRRTARVVFAPARPDFARHLNCPLSVASALKRLQMPPALPTRSAASCKCSTTRTTMSSWNST